MTETFTIKGETIDLIKLVKAAGLTDTGGMAKRVIEEGLITVDGHVEYRKAKKIRDGQRISFNNHTIIIRSSSFSLNRNA